MCEHKFYDDGIFEVRYKSRSNITREEKGNHSGNGTGECPIRKNVKVNSIICKK